MEQENINKLYDLIKNIPITEKNADVIEELKDQIIDQRVLQIVSQ